MGKRPGFVPAHIYRGQYCPGEETNRAFKSSVSGGACMRAHASAGKTKKWGKEAEVL